jgi:hypothetical protein
MGLASLLERREVLESVERPNQRLLHYAARFHNFH